MTSIGLPPQLERLAGPSGSPLKKALAAKSPRKRKKRSPATRARYKANEKAAKARKTKQVEDMVVAFEQNKKALEAAQAAIDMGTQNLEDVMAAAETQDSARLEEVSCNCFLIASYF